MLGPQLGPYAARVPAMLNLGAAYLRDLASTRAVGTLANARREFAKFAAWLGAPDPQAATSQTVAMYLAYVLQHAKARGVGPSPVLHASAGISCYFAVTWPELPDPTAGQMCAGARAAAHRLLTGNTVKLQRSPMQPEHVHTLVAHHLMGSEPCTLAIRMAVTAAVVSFAGFLRPSDVRSILVHEDLLRFHPTHMDIFLCRSKTDQQWEGEWVTIAALPDSPCCPVQLLQDLLTAGAYQRTPAAPDQDVGPLLRAVYAPREGPQRLRQVTGTLANPIPALAATTYAAHFKEACEAAGLPQDILPHSGRIGGASAAAANNVQDRLFMRQGRWRSETSKNLYTRETLEHRLQVSRNLGL